MRIEVGQLRRWKSSTTSFGDIFLVVSIEDEPIAPGSSIWACYIQQSEVCYDDIDWMQEHSEIVHEGG